MASLAVRVALVFASLSTAAHAASPTQCLTAATGLAVGGGYARVGGDSDIYPETRGVGWQLQGDYAYCGWSNVSLGGSVHYWHGLAGLLHTSPYDLLSFDGVAAAYAHLGPVDLGVRGGLGLILFFKPTTPDGPSASPQVYPLMTPFIGPHVTWWVKDDLGLVLLGDLRMSTASPAPDAYQAIALGGSLGVTKRW